MFSAQKDNLPPKQGGERHRLKWFCRNVRTPLKGGKRVNLPLDQTLVEISKLSFWGARGKKEIFPPPVFFKSTQKRRTLVSFLEETAPPGFLKKTPEKMRSPQKYVDPLFPFVSLGATKIWALPLPGAFLDPVPGSQLTGMPGKIPLGNLESRPKPMLPCCLGLQKFLLGLFLP